MFARGLPLPEPGLETFFLWGPRQTGKTTLLRERFPNAFRVDLLRADEYRRYIERPERLREELNALPSRPAQVVIDEIQRVPALLDEAHALHEAGFRLALSASSARKVRRGTANLLGARAMRYELHGLTASELGNDLDLVRLLNRGYLPSVYQTERPAEALAAYVGDYLKEAVAAEGLVRNLPVFSRFLNTAARSDGNLVNFANIARECGISGPTVKGHFSILEDTLLGRWLPAYTKRQKRRVIGAPKFYFFDVGVVNHLARRGTLEPGGELFGKAFENWVFHEIAAANAYGEHNVPLAYWRLASGIEVNFILGNMKVAIDARATARVTSDHLKGLRHLEQDHPNVRQVLVCLEPRRRVTSDGISILPVDAFVRDIHELLAAAR